MSKRQIRICLGNSCFSRGNNMNLGVIKKYLIEVNMNTENKELPPISKMLLNSDKITLLVGTCINTTHQEPNFPVELEIRRNMVKKN